MTRPTVAALVRRTATFAAAIALVAAGLVSSAPSARAAGPLDGFDPGNLVSDAVFFDSSRMSRTQVADFVAARGANCQASPSGVPCLKDYRANTPSVAATARCALIAARTNNTAAGMISDVATACGVNPQMLLILIQRESSLVTASGANLTTTRYERATGAGCPDYLPCEPGTANFFRQVYSAADRFQVYRANPSGYPYRAGQTAQILYNPEESCGRASVFIANQATAGLYIYTPYVPNKAALDVGTGTGDLCSTYGQRNFYYYLKQWFPASAGSSTAAPIYPSPPSTVTPALTAIYARSAELGLKRTGSAIGYVTAGNGYHYKNFANLSIVWDSRNGTTLAYKVARGQVPVPLVRFKDVPVGTQFAAEIEWMRATRVSEGYADGTYRPVTPVKRDAMAAFLYRAAGSPAFTAPSKPTFADVAASNQFYKEIEWLAAAGISTGWTDGRGVRTYRPLDDIERNAMAAFLYRAAGKPAYTPPASPSFRDVPVGAPFRSEIEWLRSTGITTGYGDGTYRPFGAVNRDTMAAFLYRRAGL